MNRQEATQYQVDGVGVLEGADVAFEQPTEFPCDECGGMVDLTALITVTIIGRDGVESEQRMSESDARALLTQMGLAPPPVLCDQHEPQEITITRAMRADGGLIVGSIGGP